VSRVADVHLEFLGAIYMPYFHFAYWDLPKVQLLVAQLEWTHNLMIGQCC
jgi:hypothetical protein